MTNDRPNHDVRILLAEDEEGLRQLVAGVLQTAGYCLLLAKDGTEALDIAKHHQGPIELLLSNVVMPGIEGPDLARHLQSVRPEMRVMLMSAYPSGVLLLDNNWHFIHKPFLPKALLQKLDEILSEEPKSLSGEVT
jgi:DNA-binding NtrC family response regulator